LLDRIDLHIEVPQAQFRDITSERTVESSAQIRERVIAPRRRQQLRFKDKPRITCNARMGSRELKQYCALDESTLKLLKFAMGDLNLSARAYDRILKVARTIVHFVTELVEGFHRVCAGTNGQAVHTGTSTISSDTGPGMASLCFAKL
jgi:predicted ATPase with chaperone activity